MTRRQLLVALILPLLAVSGCISIGPKPQPPPRLFVLEAGQVPRLEGAPIDAVISVAEPEGEHTILGTDLVWRTGDERRFVTQANQATQWSTQADEALQQMLASTLSQQGRFRAAVPQGGGRADYEVRWDVVTFEVLDDGQTLTARFQADVHITDATRHVIAAQPFVAESRVADRTATATAQALVRAAREGCAHIGAFAADAAAQAQAQAAAQPERQPRAASIRR